MRTHELHELARLYAIQLSYDDATGQRRNASRDALVAILTARAGTGDLNEALRARREQLSSRVVEPVIMAWGHRAAFEVRSPHELDRVEYELTLESGDRFAGRLDASTEPSHRATNRLTIPHELPFGYHALRVTVDGRTHETLIMAAPRTAPAAPRSWGIFLPLYAARTERTRGLGDLGDLAAYRRWINSMGGGIVATLPMLAAFPDEPSPYSPVSRLYWNELYLDLDALPEFRPEDLDVDELAAIAGNDQVDYWRANTAKRRALERMESRFEPDPAFERFASRAADYAEFRSHKERELRSTAADDRPIGTHRYHLYVQYRMAQQMRGVAEDARRSGPGLYLDFPLGVNPGGYDIWRYRDDFANDVSVGAPPDAFFTKGQNWGFPPFDPDAIRERRYEYFRACVRHHVEHAGILRIDHVMGLHRLFWIPQGGQPADGVYVRYPHDELYAVLLIEANRTGTAIVGEDLGTVPEYVPVAMSRHGLRQMYALQYELKPEGREPAGRPPAASMASINTHDMPPFAAFWLGDDIEERLARGLLDEGGAAQVRQQRQRMRESLAAFLTARGLLEWQPGDTLDGTAVAPVLKALLAWLGSGDAEMVLVNLEDLWLEREPQNVPGVPERSWRHKLRLALNEARHDATVTRILRTIDEQRRKGDGHTQKADEGNSAGRRAGRRVDAGERDESARR